MSESNGQPSPNGSGGQGELLTEDLQNEKRRGKTLDMLRRAVVNGWKIDPKWTEELPKVAAQIAANTAAPRRDRLRALQVLSGMHKSHVENLIALDRIERLEDERPTENLGISQIGQERARIIADRLNRVLGNDDPGD